MSPGDRILIPDPGWPNYQMMADVLSAQAVLYPLLPDEGYLPDLDRLDELARTSGATVLMINSPGNPTGAVFPRDVMERLVDLAARHDMYLLSDECYEQVVFEGEHVSPASLGAPDHVLSVFSMSKSYAMTGWRMGYVTGPSDVVDLVAKVQEPMISCATAIAQKAGQAALDGDQDCVREMTRSYRDRRDMVVEILREGGLLVSVPHGAFYIMADVSAAAQDSYAFARRLITEAGVAVAPGETFGPSGAGHGAVVAGDRRRRTSARARSGSSARCRRGGGRERGAARPRGPARRDRPGARADPVVRRGDDRGAGRGGCAGAGVHADQRGRAGRRRGRGGASPATGRRSAPERCCTRSR